MFLLEQSYVDLVESLLSGKAPSADSDKLKGQLAILTEIKQAYDAFINSVDPAKAKESRSFLEAQEHFKSCAWKGVRQLQLPDIVSRKKALEHLERELPHIRHNWAQRKKQYEERMAKDKYADLRKILLK